MPNIKRDVIIAVVGVVLLVVAVSAGKGGESGLIKIGVISPVTGTGSSYGEPIANAAILASEEINRTGGIDGKQVQLIVEDGKCDGTEAANAAQKLIEQDGVKIILGGGCSTESLVIAPIANAREVLQIAAATSHNDYTNAGPFSFRVMPKADLLASRIADIAFEKGARRVAVLNEQKDYPDGVVDSFIKRFEELGGEITLHVRYQPDETDLRTPILRIGGTDSDSIMFSSQDDKGSQLFYRQLKELGLAGKYDYFFHDWTGLTKTVFEDNSDLVASRAFSVAAWVDPTSSQVQGIRKEYEERFGAPYTTADLWVTSSYDRLFLVKEAVEFCRDEKDTECMARYLLSSIADWEGAMGRITFDQNGDIDTDMYVQYFDASGQEVKERL